MHLQTLQTGLSTKIITLQTELLSVMEIELDRKKSEWLLKAQKVNNLPGIGIIEVGRVILACVCSKQKKINKLFLRIDELIRKKIEILKASK